MTRLRADSSGACCFCIRVTAVARFTACLPALTIDSSPDPRRRRVCCRLALGMWWWWGFFWCLSQEALFDFCYQSSSESCVLTWDEPHSHFCLLNISVILFLYSAFMQTRVFCEYDINVTTVWIQHLDSVCLLENLRKAVFCCFCIPLVLKELWEKTSVTLHSPSYATTLLHSRDLVLCHVKKIMMIWLTDDSLNASVL